MSDAQELVVIDHSATPMPVFSGQEMAAAVIAYRDLQTTLDRSMPDQIMAIGDKRFRKKGYWRAIAVAFNLSVECVEERREVQGAFADGAENFGYLVTYRASSRGGRAVTGDGSCYAHEKAHRFKCPHPHPSWRGKSLHFPATTCPDYDPAFAWLARPLEATEHNVRAHAHTRGFNRAVSSLVGFGEVSAEEADVEVVLPTPAAPPRETGPILPGLGGSELPPEPYADEPGAEGVPKISEAQGKRLFAIARSAGWSPNEFRGALQALGYPMQDDIPRKVYDRLCEKFGKPPER